jgi:hypothetical protein
MGFDMIVVAGVSHRRHDNTPCLNMLLVGNGNNRSRSSPVRRDWRRCGGAVLSLRVLISEKVSFSVPQKKNNYFHRWQKKE